MNKIELINIDSQNWLQICMLSPSKEGRNFVASNSFSIAQSVYENGWVVKGIALDGQLIGFTMYGPSSDYPTHPGAYEICRLMIDEEFQGKGYGKRALAIIADELFTKYEVDEVFLSTGPDNARGIHVYQSLGFFSTGEFINEDDEFDAEEVFCLKRSTFYKLCPVTK